MAKHITLWVFILCGVKLLAQVPEFDKLELLYKQGHYKMVFRKANRILDKPEYDYSYLPEFYKSLSTFRLVQNKRWYSRHPEILEESVILFSKIKQSPEAKWIIDVHLSELVLLKSDLKAFLKDNNTMNQKENFEPLSTLVKEFLADIPDLTDEFKGEEHEATDEDKMLEAFGEERDAIVQFATTYLGVPYLWAGNDPNGFDCSGFTCYVMKQRGKDLPRRAIDQYQNSRKVSARNAQKGDLVFFDAGSGISHVGVLISERGKPLVMIHASSSNGVMITEIEQNEYWLKRLKGFGTYMY